MQWRIKEKGCKSRLIFLFGFENTTRLSAVVSCVTCISLTGISRFSLGLFDSRSGRASRV